MAAFAVTLVPAAAFAGVTGDASVAASSIKVEQVASNTLQVTYNVKKDANTAATGTLTNVDLEVTTTEGKAVSATYYGYDSSNGWTQGYGVPDGDDAVSDTWAYRIVVPEAGDYKVTATTDTDVLPGSGNYTVKTTNVKGSQLLAINEDGSAKTSVTVDQNDAATIEFKLVNTDGSACTVPVNDNGNVVVWATQGGNIVTNGTYTGVTATDNPYVYEVNNGGAVENGADFTVAFPAADDYVIHAAIVDDADQIVAGTNPDLVFDNVNVLGTLQTATVKVEAAEVVTNSVSFDEAKNGVWYINDKVTPSDTKEYTVHGTAYEAANNVAENTTLTLSCEDNGDGITLAKTEVNTDEKGRFSFKFTLSETAKYEINVLNEEGKVIGTLIIDQDDVNAASIDKISDGGIMLAGNDVNYSSQVYGNVSANNPVYFGDAVKLSITDVYGVEAEGGLVLKGEAAADKDATHPYKHSDNLRVVDKPEATDTTAASTLTADDLELAWDPTAGVYTLAYVGDNAAKDLVPGDYAVRVALNQGGDEAVTVYFTLAKFGTAESIDFNITAAPGDADTYNDDAIKAIDDKVALGQYVTVEPVYVDENGLRVVIPTKNYSAAVTGKAVAENNTKNGNFWFTTRSNTISNEALIGSEVTVQVMDKKLGYQTKTLTIVSAYLNETLAFDSEQGPVDKTNTVNVTVVDENGDLVKVNGTLSAYVADQSNEDATVDVDVNKSVKNGAGKIYVESNAEGTADIVVAVKAVNGEMYANTLHYTFGDEDEYAGRYVVMTIGSSDYLINNEIVKGDAAPYVDDAWRTMVPFRVLGEAFGAEVDWNQEAQSVTYTVGDTEIVMTIGENTYTLNGEEQTMDTAPVLSGDRTYVPVRFVAEDLGFEVTPLYDVENGATASVVFQK